MLLAYYYYFVKYNTNFFQIWASNNQQFAGLYSGKIFSRCGYEVKSEVKYDEFRDGAGELYLNDTREHTEIRYCVKRLLD